MTIIEQLEDCLDFSTPFAVKVGDGAKHVRKSPVSSGFWDLWREHKSTIKEAGYSVSKFRDKWEVCQWLNSPGDAPRAKPESKVIVNDTVLADMPELAFPGVLKTFQKPLVSMGVLSMSKYNANLVGHGTGVGKTFISLGITRERGRRIGVICPKTIIPDWYAAAKLMGVEVFAIEGWEYVKTGKTDFGCFVTKERRVKKKGEWVIEQVKDHFVFNVPGDVDVIFDEAHRARHHGTLNSLMVYAAKKQGIPLMLLSATLATNPVEMDATGYALGLHRGWKDYFTFMKENGCFQTRFGYKFSGKDSVLKRVSGSIFPSRGQRVRPSDLGAEFPETTVTAKAFTVDQVNEIAETYTNLQNELASIEERMAVSESKAHMLAALTRARQRIELLKAPTIANLATDTVDEGNSVFITVNFKETLAFLQTKFKGCVVIQGGQTPTARSQSIADFQSGKARVLIGINLACQEGISLHDTTGEFPRVAYHMPCLHGIGFKQVLGRVSRIGGKSPSFQFICYCAGVDVEEDACASLASKLNGMSEIMDGEADPMAKFMSPQDSQQ